MKAIDIEQLLSEERWNGYAKRLVLGTVLSLAFAGIDNQILVPAIPVMAAEWGTSPGNIYATLSVNLFGIILGGLIGGLLGDRIGRRTALQLSVVIFAVATLSTSAVGGVVMLAFLNFIFALGYGAAIPNAAVLAYESVPKRNRVFAVTLTVIATPLGGRIASFLFRWALPTYGWRALYILGGVISIALAFILFKELPESPQYLARHRQRWPELIALLRRLGHSLPADSIFAEVESDTSGRSNQTIRGLVRPRLLRNAAGILCAFFFCQMANYFGIAFLPLVLNELRFSPRVISDAASFWILGGIAGALSCVFLIHRLGPRIAIAATSAASVVAAIVISFLPIGFRETAGLIVLLVLLGGFINAVQSALYILALDTYSSDFRATGVGAALAISRVGNLMAGYVGGYAITKGAVSGYFLSLAIVMALTLVSFTLFRRHLEHTHAVVLER